MTINTKRIEMALAAHGMTKAELSERAGVSRQSVSTIVRRGTCKPETAGKLSKALGIPLQDLMEV